MRVVRIVDPESFLEERARYQLAHTCERCVYRDEDKGACAHGYPDGTHREAAFAPGEAGGMFCKEFELA